MSKQYVLLQNINDAITFRKYLIRLLFTECAVMYWEPAKKIQSHFAGKGILNIYSEKSRVVLT